MLRAEDRRDISKPVRPLREKHRTSRQKGVLRENVIQTLSGEDEDIHLVVLAEDNQRILLAPADVHERPAVRVDEKTIPAVRGQERNRNLVILISHPVLVSPSAQLDAVARRLA